jgi:holo-[acyl-carrier protein] synthase
LLRLYTEAELRYCLSKANLDERLAGRFAAKEAASKALGTGFSRGVTWRDLEVRREDSGRPTMYFSGIAAAVAETLGVAKAHVTITHTNAIAFAVVILES